MAEYFQDDKLLMIRTILDDDPVEQRRDGDPLLLLKLDGTEGISRLSSYDVAMLRDADRPSLDVTRLIGTHVFFSARPDNNFAFDNHLRSGMFESVEEVSGVDTTKFGAEEVRKFRMYRARILPWVSVLAHDICYRVFEQKTVVQIIDAIRLDVRKAFPHVMIDTSTLNNGEYPFLPIEYCVQYGESTLAFLSRLMARFGIWYYFTGVKGYNVINHVMALRGPWQTSAPPAWQPRVLVVDDDPAPHQIAKLVRHFRPPQHKVVVGGFNQHDPYTPFYAAKDTDLKRDLLSNRYAGSADRLRWFVSTSFAEPVGSKADASLLAGTRATENQTNVVTLSGSSRNPSFLAGHKFQVVESSEDDPSLAKQEFVVDAFNVTVHDYRYINLPGWQILDLFFNTYSVPDADKTGFGDAAMSKVSLWLSNASQNQRFPLAYAPKRTDDNDLPPGTINFGRAWAAQIGLTALNILIQGIDWKRVATDQKNIAVYSNGFFAFSADAPVFPLPAWSRPSVRGPHTAVVIGQNGTDTAVNNVYCDWTGRVRVRFPWDPGPPHGDDHAPSPFPVDDPGAPAKAGGNTCWVRVVEGWAGRKSGSQFLPRVGQEVLVDFLDGDPEQPVIVGRLYNRDRSPQPFLPDSQDRTITNPGYSGIQTYSIPTRSQTGALKPAGFHLLRFNDSRDHEQYLIRSQWRMDVATLGSYYDTNLWHRHVTIGHYDDTTNKAVGDHHAKVYGDYHLRIGDVRDPHSGSVHMLAEGNYGLHVKRGTNLVLDGGLNISAGDKATISIHAGTIVLDAKTNISLTVGNSSIVLDPTRVWVSPPNSVSVGGVAELPIAAAVRAPTEPYQADFGEELRPIPDPRKPASGT